MAPGALPPAPTGFEHRFATVDGLRFHYVAGGRVEGETVVLLAGAPESWFAWREVMPLLAERHHVIAIDLPGQGDSDKPLDGYDTETLARRVHGLMVHLGLDRYALVAHDVGAWVAFPYALLFPDEVSKLVLMDAGIPGVTLPDQLPSSPDKAWKTWHFAFHAVADLPEQLLAGRERLYLEWFFRTKTADPRCYSRDVIDEYERLITAPGALRAFLAWYREGARSAAQNRLLLERGKLAMPVLGLSADQGIGNIAEKIRPFAAGIVSDATITDCGHFQPEEQPEAVAEAILRFLA